MRPGASHGRNTKEAVPEHPSGWPPGTETSYGTSRVSRIATALRDTQSSGEGIASSWVDTELRCLVNSSHRIVSRIFQSDEFVRHYVVMRLLGYMSDLEVDCTSARSAVH